MLCQLLFELQFEECHHINHNDDPLYSALYQWTILNVHAYVDEHEPQRPQSVGLGPMW